MTDTHLLKTPLHSFHIENGARMVPFAGYDMPVQYPLGVKQEHLHTRAKAGLFDVSHMGQFKLVGSNGAQALEQLLPIDVIDLPEGKQRYALLLNEQGGILDDLMVTNAGSYHYLVVNAACKVEDAAHIRAHLPEGLELQEMADHALLALQGPAAVDVLATLNPAVAELKFMDNVELTLLGETCRVSRSGYTGEDGYEISVPAAKAVALASELLSHEQCELIGLGARDSLRLESGLCLYGHDMNAETDPVSASLIWAISKARRADGERAGGFMGAEPVLKALAEKRPAKKRVGLIGSTRAPVREGTQLFDASDKPIGVVTSGTFGPSCEKSISMAYVNFGEHEVGTEVFAEVRGKKIAMTVSKMPFVEQRYVR
ncbi:glycine cleavage system aminomethyltransferase GcvT [Reinekea marinisedimentorum]|uniref:aminomethyltransferase n=1 Tax=Reinekea marinisedimentorum TaxID=230495 RepID=A0A4R3I5M8_9GAMM|nr:glycine cleavage system aminomethyltransferase GcvT [Reinekea marinisedimentorum]TCS40431.1 aminomethyltransferase [Reinekea marinisedimentorum]